MKAMREIGHQDVPWVHTQWGSREVDVRARDELLARLFKEISTGKTSGGVLGQFARCWPTTRLPSCWPQPTASCARPAAGRRGRTLRRGGPRHSWEASRWERTCSNCEPSWARWPSRFSACVSGCLSAYGCHLTSLQKRGACPHCPGRTGLQKTIVFKNRCPLLLSSRVWRCNHDSSILESLCREQLHHPGDSTVNCHRRVAVLRHAITSPHSRQKT